MTSIATHTSTCTQTQYVGTSDAAPGQGAGYAEYARHEVLQMVGRAGRPQFDTEVRAGGCKHLKSLHDCVSSTECINTGLCPNLHIHTR